MPSISAVVPVFNGSATIPALVDRLTTVLRTVADDFEIVLVDDGSADGSWATIEDLAAAHDHVLGIALARNYGQHAALLAGIRAARYDLIVTLDDDLQNPPEEIPKLLAALTEGYDVVYGAPMRDEHGIKRRLASRATKLVLRKDIGPEIAPHVSTFRMFRSSLRDAFAGTTSPFVSIDVLLSWATSRFAVVKVAHSARSAGRSQYTFRRLVRHMLTMVTGFSTWPLRLASIVGFALTAFGAGVLVYVVISYLTIHTQPGFAFLASLMAILGGAQLFALGIFGEYLARVHIRLMDRPAYAVRASTRGHHSHEATGSTKRERSAE